MDRSPDRELVEEVARALSVARCGLPDGAYSEADARVVIPLVEKATLERVAPLVAYCKWKIDMDPSVGLDDERLIGDALAALDSLGEGEE